jgi:hypothetical protein
LSRGDKKLVKKSDTIFFSFHGPLLAFSGHLQCQKNKTSLMLGKYLFTSMEMSKWFARDIFCFNTNYFLLRIPNEN